MKLSDILAFLNSPDAFQFVLEGKTVPHFYNEAGTFDENTRFYAAGYEHGAVWIIAVPCYRGDGFEKAYEIFIDENPTIPKEELVEAYGPDEGENCGTSFLDIAREAARPTQPGHLPWNNPEYNAWRGAYHKEARRLLQEYTIEGERHPDLIEGYAQQSNASGTGVVNVGHYAWCREVTDELEIEKRQP